MKFIYTINEDWWIIIEPNIHYYYNVKTKQSYWQLPSELNFSDINVNEVLVLIAKSKGLKVDINKEELSHQEGANFTSLGHDKVEKVPATRGIEEEEPEGTKIKEIDVAKAGKGLTLGYLSSDDDLEEEEHSNDIDEIESDFEGEDNQQESEGFFNVDEIISLIINNESKEDSEIKGVSETQDVLDDSAEQFIQVLNTHKNEISIYNPYSITEESLITELSQTPSFYNLTFGQREKLYNQWAGTINDNPQKYPSGKQRFMQYLFSVKDRLKNSYYFDFKSELAPFDVMNKNHIFTTYKNVLHQQTAFEKHYKKDGTKDKLINLKKLKLLQFLKDHKIQVPTEYSPQGETDFDKWICLCNDLSLPETVAENEMNWVVGDSKRLECYLNR